MSEFGRIDVLVNNAAEQHPKKEVTEISPEQLDRTFRTNIYGYFYMVQAAMPHLKEGAAIVNTTSVTAYRGSLELLDYSSTKGRSSPSRARWRNRSSARAFASTSTTPPSSTPRRRSRRSRPSSSTAPSDQHLWLLLHGAGRNAPPQGRGGDRQHHLGDGVPRVARTPRLFLDQGGDRHLHALAGAIARRQGHSRQWRRAGTDLDAADPVHLPSREGRDLRGQHAHEAAGQPNEVASCFLFLACEDSSYVTGSVLHPNGGDPTES
jgi:hypothetical protein